MHYLGGKARLAKDIGPYLVAAKGETGAYVEPFLGAGSVAAFVGPHFDTLRLSDASADLVLMWQALQAGWVPPGDVTPEEYAALRHAEPSALRGFAGFACSFGGKWFGGYARDPRKSLTFAQTAYRSLAPRVARLDHAEFKVGDYRDTVVNAGDVVYCDPPYAGTTGYDAVGGFDAAEFWATVERWDAGGAHVFVSEFTAPARWRAVWRKDRRVGVEAAGNFTRTDSLYTVN